jgi:iron complex outermembrane receptor protein
MPMRRERGLTRRFMWLAASGLAVAPAPGLAQTASDSAEMALEEVVVTARKREESLQDVPMSISAVSGETLEKAGYAELNNLNRISSNVFFEAADRSKPLIFIRGVGTRSYDAGSDPSVGVFLDGVYLGRFGALDMDLLDVARVEVLKGPQGTLYGRNTIGGAISVVTRDPTDAFTGRLTGEVGVGDVSGDDLYGLNVTLSGPLSETVSASLSGGRRYRDGFQPVGVAGVRGGSEDSWSVRGKVRFDLGDAQLRLSADYADADGPPLILVPNDLSGRFPNPGALAPGFVTPREPANPYRPASDTTDQGIRKETYGASAQLDWTFGGLTLTSISAARSMSLDERDDLDGSTLPFQIYEADEESDQVSQELRLAYAGERINWLVGAYFSREDVKRTETILFGPASLLTVLAGPTPLVWDFGVDLESTSLAAFGQLQWEITDALSATIGARYSDDEKDVVFDTRTTVPIGIASFRAALSRSWSSFDPSIAMNYRFNDDVMAYASWATGYKSGAFQFIAISAAVANQVAEPEEVESIEVGVKSTLFDNRVRFNAAAFTMDYKDLQQLRLVPIGGGTTRVVISNAGSSRIKGIELEAKAILSPEWSIDANYGYLDAQFKDYVFNATSDFSGNRMPRSPEHTASVALNYEREVAWGLLQARLGYAWRDSIFFEADNNVIDPESSEGALGLLDFSASLTRDRWTIGVWGRNLTDERYRRQVLNSTGAAQRGIWAEPRTVGLRVSYELGNQERP